MSSLPFDEQLNSCKVEPKPENSPEALPAQRSYGQILKSSAIVGGSTMLNVGIGIARTKAMAMLLGPSGFGLAGLFTSIITLTQSVAGIGVNSSGVRQIAEAAGSDDKERIARTTVVLRRASVVLGLLGAAALVLFSKQVSVLTFGNAGYRSAVCLISLAVFFQLVSAGQGALIQGMRRIGDLAKMNVIGALSGFVISVPVVYVLREKGIALALVLVAATTIVTSWWYSRKIRIKPPALTVAQVSHETAGLLKLGIAFMASGLMVPGVAYFARVFLAQKVGMAATGMYQSAWTLGGLYVGFILQAMGADFYPRLSAVAHDNAQCNRLVNEQALVGLLLAGPGIVATLTFAPTVIAAFYSSRFGAAVGVLRWICLGAVLQVVSWPMGFIIVAKAKQNLFLLSESLWTLVALALNWFLIRIYGLNGAGMAFFAAYVFHVFLTYGLVFYLTDFRWSSENRQIGMEYLIAIGFIFCACYRLTPIAALCLGIAGVLLSAAYSLRELLRLVDDEFLPPALRSMVARFRLATTSEAAG